MMAIQSYLPVLAMVVTVMLYLAHLLPVVQRGQPNQKPIKGLIWRHHLDHNITQQ